MSGVVLGEAEEIFTSFSLLLRSDPQCAADGLRAMVRVCFVLHLGRLVGGSGEFDEEDVHAHGASYPWACDLMLAPRGRSSLRFSIFAIPFVYILGHLSFLSSSFFIKHSLILVLLINISNHISFFKVRPRDHHPSSSSTLSMKTAAISDPGNSSCLNCHRVICRGWVCESISWSSICWIRDCWVWLKGTPASGIRLERMLRFLNVGGWKLVWSIQEVSPFWIDCLNGFPIGKQVCSTENESC